MIVTNKVLLSLNDEYAKNYYLRDAQGNEMANYELNMLNTTTGKDLTVTARPIYGSSRLGLDSRRVILWQNGTNVSTDTPTVIKNRILSMKQYQLSNHLGNVHVTVSDKRIAKSYGVSTVDYFEPEITTISDYYAFGSPMPSRTWSDPNTKYKYGFNGKEKDNEVNVDEGDYDFGARIYDSRLGRWLALDPLAFRFPWQSPYVAFNNNPLLYNDPTGKSGEATIDKNTKTITITSIYLFYGSGSSPAIAKEYAASIEKMYNAANGVVNIDGVDYKVQFKIIGIDISEFSNKTIQNVIGMNKDIKRNYVRLEKKTNELISGSSYTDASSSGGNTGYWSTDQIKDSKGTTPSHEHNHSLGGLDHPEHYNFNGGNFNLEPSIDMTADSYNFVKRKYNIVIKVKDKVKSFWMDITKRKVKQRNIDAFFTKAVKEQLSKTGKANIGTLSNEFH